MSRPTPRHEQAPAVQRLRVRFAKRGRLRFTSHRDFQRAFERALRRAGLPVAHSHGFTPHPKVSYAGAAPMGAASEAEYLELSLTERRDPHEVRAALDAALPSGLDVLDVVEAGPGVLADRLQASAWRIALPGAEVSQVSEALEAFRAAGKVDVERLTKNGVRILDAGGAVLRAEVVASEPPVIEAIVRHQSPTVRPDEILAGLRLVAGFDAPEPPRVTRLAQGAWHEAVGRLDDPLEAEHAGGAASRRHTP